MSSLFPPCSFVVPCLNEARSILRVIRTIQTLRPQFEDLEVLVVDNGSHDETPQLVRNSGARLLECRQPGYGAALRHGLMAASHNLVVILDGDDSYDAEEAPRLIQELLSKRAHLVVGNRLIGEIEPGAMPFLHRWLGTPALSFLISTLYGQRVRDCNGGMRVFERREFMKWNPQSPGMEFASEMIICALQAKAVYLETPIRYRKSPKGRIPHLRPLRDGLRHLHQICRMTFREQSKP